MSYRDSVLCYQPNLPSAGRQRVQERLTDLYGVFVGELESRGYLQPVDAA
jgi:hypothetical protein